MLTDTKIYHVIYNSAATLIADKGKVLEFEALFEQAIEKQDRYTAVWLSMSDKGKRKATRLIAKKGVSHPLLSMYIARLLAIHYQEDGR